MSYRQSNQSNARNVAIGLIIILSMCGLVVMAAFMIDFEVCDSNLENCDNYSESIRDFVKDPEPYIPKNTDFYQDDDGNLIGFYKPPGADLDQQLSSDTIFNSNDPEAEQTLELIESICAENNSYFDPEIGENGSCVSNEIFAANSTSTNSTNTDGITSEQVTPIEELDIDISGISYKRDMTKVVSSGEDGGLPYVNRGERALIVGIIKLTDPSSEKDDNGNVLPDVNGNYKYLRGPFYYNGEITGPQGQFIYATKPGSKTTPEGTFEILYSTDSSDVDGIYTVKVTAETADQLSKITKTINFELRK